MLAESIRPKLKTTIYYVPVPEGGVYLRGNNCRLMLKGRSLYPLLERLIPLLNGNITIEELTSGLDAERRRMITHLLEKLFAHRFLKDAGEDQTDALPLPMQETYASNLTFIESFQASAATHFEDFRQQHLLILGSGRAVISLAQAGLQCGMSQIDALVMSEGEAGSSVRQDICDLVAHCASAEQTVQMIDLPGWDNQTEVRKLIQGYDAVLHIAERPTLARAQLLNRLCVEEQKTFMQALIIGDQAWLGPLVCAQTEGCWECAWRRWQANLSGRSAQPSDYEFEDRPQVPESRFLAAPQMAMIANRLLFTLFKQVTQTGSTETERCLDILYLDTGLSESHAFLPHPHCQTCQHPGIPTAAGFLEQIQQLQRQSPDEQNSFLERLTNAVVDPRLGLFTTPESGHFVQAPLAIYKATLSDPMLQKNAPEVLTIATLSRNTQDATALAAQKACTLYAANLVNRRRLFPFPPEAKQEHIFPALFADQWIGMPSFPGQQELWSWALDLQTQQVCPVPAAYAFPALCRPDQGTEPARGAASGMSWEEAICQALLDWCNYLTVEELKEARQAYAQVEISRVLLTSQGEYLYRLLKTAVGEQLFVYDVTGPLGVPTFAICLGERVVTYSTHWDAAQALERGFALTFQQCQAEQCQQFEYAVAPVPDLPSSLRAPQLSVPRSTQLDTWSARQEWLLQRLQANSLRALAVPLDHDPALTRILPFIVRVLLCNVELKRGE
ncbi:MAG TPA: TOMM precursor leader peptide-binding protein [Ktedonobacteraceae bacterium]|nr:TOMM precursor leader peptide-binding protein [Ktedonobacteraceae bacterium]